jgi:PAS domain S-box-containing protein
MMDGIEHFLSTDGFMPHGMCYLWRPGVLGLHVVSDSLITLAYFSIPFTLLYFVRKRTDLQFNWIFVCFAIFIVACGTTHLMEVWTIWHATYWLSGTIKAITAFASVPTAILLIKLVPDALGLPSPSALRNANMELAREVAERQRAEDKVHRTNAQLEARVAERTAQLEAANRSLLQEARERQRAEETMRESEERFRTLAESLPHLVWTCRPDGWCDYLSRQWVDYTGRPQAEQLGSGWAEHLHPSDRDRVQGEWATATARGDSYDAEFRIRRADGVHRWFRTRAVPLRDGAGRIVKWFGSNTDIDDYKLSEQRLRTQLERLALLDRTTRAIGDRQDPRSILQVVIRSLEDHLPIDFGCVCLHQPASPALSVACVGTKSRPLALQLAIPEHTEIEIDHNGLARCMAGQLVHEPDITQSKSPFPRRLASGGLGSLVIAPLAVESKVFGVVVAARREAGQFSSGDCEFLRQLSEHVALALHQADLYGALQRAYEDLRQTQQSVMQQERLRALGQMASGIAHDINNALSPAALYTQSLLERDSSLSSQAKESLVIIQRAIEDVAHTVARMREFYRHRGRQRPHDSINLNHAIEQVIELTRARWSAMPEERGVVIRMQTDLSADLPVIIGVEAEIRDALTNLILNAVDAMPSGGLLTLRSRTFESDQVRVDVIDTGTGMDEATRTRCMEPFFTTKGERGTGLGLTMVYGMLERHSGEIEIDSVPGKGTLVRLIFPAATTSAAATGGPLSILQPSRSLRILFVDDDPIMLKSLRDTLEQDGHSVIVADGGQRGIETFQAAEKRSERFSVVITDLGMPHVDGRTVAAAIKSTAPNVPVILLTGWGHRLIAENDVPPHVDRVLSKPPKLAALRLALAELTSEAPA